MALLEAVLAIKGALNCKGLKGGPWLVKEQQGKKNQRALNRSAINCLRHSFDLRFKLDILKFVMCGNDQFKKNRYYKNYF